MTKLNWRLKDLPTANEVASLVEHGVITKEEAKEMLFKDKKEIDTDSEIKSLQEQVKFLEKVVENLSQNRSTLITYTPTYPRPWTWTSGNVLCGAVTTNAATGGSGTTYSINTGALLN